MKEEEIRPASIFDEYLSLTKQDTDTYFRNSERQDINCPACLRKGEHAFRKQGFDYSVCRFCHTLYVSPRPDENSFKKYYTESPSSEFWATTFYKATADARREKLWKPKALMISEMIERTLGTTGVVEIIDIGGGYGIFADEMRKIFGDHLSIIEPGPKLAENCRELGFPVIEKFLEEVETEDLPKGAKVFVSFELFEHLHDPELFLRKLSSLMNSGDLFIFTTLSGIGFDILHLWDHSNSVSPPHHLNFFNPNSCEIILNRVGFKLVEAKTPGKLDLDIFENAVGYERNRFWEVFFSIMDEEAKADWQRLIASSGLSSHMMISCQKP